MNSEDGRPKSPEISRKTLRLTFQPTDGGLELLSVESLKMITPAQPGERPDASRNGGNWFELRDDKGQVLAHRLIDASLLNSAEVHSPDGRLTRVFGGMKKEIFEVLLPDTAAARSAVLVGSPLNGRESVDFQSARSGDIASFDLPGRSGERK